MEINDPGDLTRELRNYYIVTPEDVIEAIESAPPFLAPFLYADVLGFNDADDQQLR